MVGGMADVWCRKFVCPFDCTAVCLEQCIGQCGASAITDNRGCGGCSNECTGLCIILCHNEYKSVSNNFNCTWHELLFLWTAGQNVV